MHTKKKDNVGMKAPVYNVYLPYFIPMTKAITSMLLKFLFHKANTFKKY